MREILSLFWCGAARDIGYQSIKRLFYRARGQTKLRLFICGVRLDVIEVGEIQLLLFGVRMYSHELDV
jgi:hypothetical protein